jgi:hypothetical protein
MATTRRRLTGPSLRQVTWPPYSLLPALSSAEELAVGVDPHYFGGLPILARPVSPTGDVADMNGFYFWPIKRVSAKLWMMAVGCLQVEKGIVAEDHARASQHEITELAAMMRHVSARWPFGDRHGATRLQTEAQRLESRFAIRPLFKKSKWPTTVVRQDQLRTSMSLWVLQELRLGLVKIGLPTRTLAEEASHVLLLKSPHSPDQDGIIGRAMAEASLERRIRQFAGRLRPDATAELMAWALHDTVSFGADDAGRISTDDAGRILIDPTPPNRSAPTQRQP